MEDLKDLVKKQIEALDADSYEITLIPNDKNDKKEYAFLLEEFNKKELLLECDEPTSEKELKSFLKRISKYYVYGKLDFLKSKNETEKYNIYITPLSSFYDYYLIDDVKPETLDEINKLYQYCLLLETSPNNYQCVVKTPHLKIDKDVKNSFFKKFNDAYGDKNINAQKHAFRLAGFKNIKKEHLKDNDYPVVKLNYSKDVVCKYTEQEILELSNNYKTNYETNLISLPVINKSSEVINKPSKKLIKFANKFYKNSEVKYPNVDYSRADFSLLDKLVNHKNIPIDNAIKIIKECSPNLSERHKDIDRYLNTTKGNYLKQVNKQRLVAKMHNDLAYINCFKTTKRGSAPKGVKIEYSKKNDPSTVIEINMFEQLDIKDQDLYLLLLAIAPQNKPLTCETEEKKWMELRKNMNIEYEFADKPTKGIETSAYNLLKSLGKSCGKSNYEWIYKSLEKLSKTNLSIKEIIRDNEGKIKSIRFIGGSSLIGSVFYEYNKNKKIDKIKILLNPLSTEVFLDSFEGGFRPINLSERFSLKSDVSKKVHYILSVLVNQGKKDCKLKEDTLIQHFAGIDCKQLSSKELSNYRSKINKACAEINNLDSWEINKSGNMYIITHKKTHQKRLINF